MAIWDDALSAVPETVNGIRVSGDSGTKSIKCPGCASNLRFEPTLNRLACRTCGSLYTPDSIEYTNHFGKLDYRNATVEDDDKTEYICDNCGAVVVTDNNTVSTFCAHCGSPTLIKRRLSKEFSPEFIIPFKFEKDEALKKVKKWLKKYKDKPRAFGEDVNLDSITGIYVPFWLISAHVNSEYSFKGISRTSKINFNVSGVPFDGSSHIDNQLMRAIEPFNYLEMVPYNDNYLPGFFAERYNENSFSMLESIEKRLENYGREYVMTTFVPESITDGKSKDRSSLLYLAAASDIEENHDLNNAEFFTYSDNLECSYALLPVYFVNINYKGIRYQLAVNGQTGEVAGDIPYDESYKTRKIVLSVIEQVLWTLLFGGYAFYYLGLCLSVELQTGFRYEVDSLILIILLCYSLLVIGFNVFVYFRRLEESRFDVSTQIDPAPPLKFYINQNVEVYERLVNMSLNEEANFGTAILKRKRPKYYMPSAARVGFRYLVLISDTLDRIKYPHRYE